MKNCITYLDLQIYLGKKEILEYSKGEFNLKVTDNIALNDLKLAYMKFVYLKEKLGKWAKSLQSVDSIDEILMDEEPYFPEEIKKFHKTNEELVVRKTREYI